MALLLLLAAVAGGTCLSLLAEDEAAPLARLAAGAVVGLTALGLSGFLFASRLGLGPASLALAAATAGAPVLLLLDRRRRGQLRADLARAAGKPSWGLVLLALLAAAVLVRVFARAAMLDASGLSTGVDHNLADLPFHLGIVQGFAVGHNFPPQHPELAGARLTYPFLVDFVAAQLVATGVPLVTALRVENLLLVLSLLVLLYLWGRQLTGEQRAAVLTPALVLLNGGLGFWKLAAEARATPGGWAALLARLPHDTSIEFDGPLRWGNAVITLLIPQRAFLLGLPLFLVVTALWWRGLREPAGSARALRRMAAAGAVAALMPLAHSHSFAVVVSMGACLALLFPRLRDWAVFFGVALAGAAPQVLWLASGSSLQAGRFLGWHLGWEAQGSLLGFWLMNTGLVIPLLLVAYLWRGPRAPVDARLKRFSLPFLLCFLVPNLLRLSPWIWDNIKFLYYWYVASTPLLALLLARLSRRGVPGALGAAGLGLLLTLSGGLDVWRAASGTVSHRIFDAEALAFARRVEAATAPGARFLTAPAYAEPVLLAGRRLLMGYEGHLWSQGLDYAGRKQAVAAIYAGGPEARALLAHYRVDYVVLGPQERRELGARAAALAGFPVAFELDGYRVYRTSREEAEE